MDELNIITTVCGYIGASLLSLLLTPQIYLTCKTKNTKGLSYLFMIINLFICINFIVYGIGIKSNPIIISNSFSFLSTIILIICKYKYDKNTIINT